MPEELFENLPWVVGLLGLFSFLAVASWSTERRKEREALYRSEAIKKVAEMGPDTPEPLLKLLRESLGEKQAMDPSVWMLPTQAREYHLHQTLQKIADAPTGGAEAAMAFLREQQKQSARKTRDGLRLAGMICLAVGIALAVFLYVAVRGEGPVYVVGLIPILVGAVLFGSSFWMRSKE